MAEFHLHGQIIKRSQGRSAVNAAAYRAGELLYDKRLDRIFDYTRKQEVEESIILGPDHAPKWLFHREMLWNTVEAAERRKVAQVAREFDIALPIELVRKDPTAAKGALKDWAQEMFVAQGLMVDINFHNMRSENPHAHIMTTMRRVDPQAMKFGEESRYAFERTKARDQNDWGYMDHWRETWADFANAAMAEHDIEARIDHRTLIEQGITDREPNIHIGPVANAMEARGADTGRWLKNALIWFHNEEPWFEENRRYLAFVEAEEEAKERHSEEEKAARKEAERKEIEAAAVVVALADVLADFSHRLDEAAEEIIGDYAVRLYSAAKRIETQARTAVERPAPHLQSLDNRLSLARPKVQTAQKRLEDTAARLDQGIERALATRSRRLQATATKLDRTRPAFAMRVAEVRRRTAGTIGDVWAMARSLAAATVRVTAKAAEMTTETLGTGVLRTTSFFRNLGWREGERRQVSGPDEATNKVQAPAPARCDGEGNQHERALSRQRFSLLEAARSLTARLSRAWIVRKANAEARAAEAAEATLIRNIQLAEQAIRARLDHNAPDIELKFVRDWIRTMRSTAGPMEARYREADRVALRGYALSLDRDPRYGDLDRALIRLSPFAGGIDISARHAPSDLPEGMKPDFRDRAIYSKHVRWVVQELGSDLAVLNHMQKLQRESFKAESHDGEMPRDIDQGRYTRRVTGRGGSSIGED